jgi:hypothetical protein
MSEDLLRQNNGRIVFAGTNISCAASVLRLIAWEITA